MRLFAEDARPAEQGAGAGDVPGCLGALASFVTVDDSRRALVENLLRGAYVFEDAARGDRFRFVREREGRHAP